MVNAIEPNSDKCSRIYQAGSCLDAANLRSPLDATLNLLEELGEEFVDDQKRIQELEKGIAERDAKIHELENNLAERDAKIRELETRVEARPSPPKEQPEPAWPEPIKPPSDVPSP